MITLWRLILRVSQEMLSPINAFASGHIDREQLAIKERDEKWQEKRLQRRTAREAAERARRVSLFGEEFVRQVESAEEELSAGQFEICQDYINEGAGYEHAIKRARNSERLKYSRWRERVYTGPRGGRYRINRKGRKSYGVL